MESSRDATLTSDAAFAQWIKEARSRAGLSQEELARRMRDRGHDFQQQTVYKLERGARRVSIGEAVALADALDLNLALFSEQDPASRAALRMRIEQQTKDLLAGLVSLEAQVRRSRDALAQLRSDIARFDEMSGDELDEWWGKRSTAQDAFDQLLYFDDLDGLQWGWEQWAYSPAGHRFLRRFGLIPASESPIPGYSDDDDFEEED
ncbi:helix-turn-helix transcriptional regulator [Microbacterium sp. CFBP 8790]|uniref:helix-turn-helix domain-containing protein n=1 Tax=unclassified Microbacterium TaxID=2609290 RepID=UPI001783155F|nr:helix-turn-helix transcriptional regulator [Microbacterium sp. CFBP 8801]MBD8508137.1 helix-turn-helix transcriptional regulator [Microbacterium sp. CFBP 8790]